jgi:osmotically-inducible protein OsmY
MWLSLEPNRKTEDADMRNAIAVIVGALGLLACSKEKPPEDTTSIRGASTEQQAANISVEEVRSALLEKRPSAADAINSLIITNDAGIITLRGKVDDESTKADLVNRVRSMPNVRGVRDEIQVQPKAAMQQQQQQGDMGAVGTTTTTGAQQGMDQQGQAGGSTGAMSNKPPMNTQDQSMGGAGGTMGTGSSHIDDVRQSMMKAKPNSDAMIQALTITANDDGSMITIAGSVPDEKTHQTLLKAAKGTTGVKQVKDQMKVTKKAATTPQK